MTACILSVEEVEETLLVSYGDTLPIQAAQLCVLFQSNTMTERRKSSLNMRLITISLFNIPIAFCIYHSLYFKVNHRVK